MERQTSFLKAKKAKSGLFTWEIFIDGAARGNPGPAGAGIYIKHTDEKIVKKGFYLGKKTNNQAEYLALALAIFLLEKIGKNPNKINIFSDSELLVKQMNKEYKVKNPILLQIKSLIDSMLKGTTCKVKHILREKNKIADELANAGIDKKTKIPATFLNLLKKNGIKV